MKYEAMKGKTFQTGNLKFKVVSYEMITEHSATLYVKILDAGFFSTVDQTRSKRESCPVKFGRVNNEGFNRNWNSIWDIGRT